MASENDTTTTLETAAADQAPAEILLPARDRGPAAIS